MTYDNSRWLRISVVIREFSAYGLEPWQKQSVKNGSLMKAQVVVHFSEM